MPLVYEPSSEPISEPEEKRDPPTRALARPALPEGTEDEQICPPPTVTGLRNKLCREAAILAGLPYPIKIDERFGDAWILEQLPPRVLDDLQRKLWAGTLMKSDLLSSLVDLGIMDALAERRAA
jgi:hypothetical protein